MSVQSNISSGNIYSFSQPNILECSNEIVDGGVTNECNKMSENDKSETTNDTIINEQNKLYPPLLKYHLTCGSLLLTYRLCYPPLLKYHLTCGSLLLTYRLCYPPLLKSLESSSSENNTNVKEIDSLSEKIELKQDQVKESQVSSNSPLEEGNTNDKSGCEKLKHFSTQASDCTNEWEPFSWFVS
jgi:hypothetical protein